MLSISYSVASKVLQICDDLTILLHFFAVCCAKKKSFNFLLFFMCKVILFHTTNINKPFLLTDSRCCFVLFWQFAAHTLTDVTFCSVFFFSTNRTQRKIKSKYLEGIYFVAACWCAFKTWWIIFHMHFREVLTNCGSINFSFSFFSKERNSGYCYEQYGNHARTYLNEGCSLYDRNILCIGWFLIFFYFFSINLFFFCSGKVSKKIVWKRTKYNRDILNISSRYSHVQYFKYDRQKYAFRIYTVIDNFIRQNNR